MFAIVAQGGLIDPTAFSVAAGFRIHLIQYSEKNKVMAQVNKGFSDNTPADMRTMVLDAGYEILEEDLTTIRHSAVVRFTKST